MPDLPPPISQTYRVSFPATLSQAREAARLVREFLSACGLSEQELFACELALVEACNNAVHHVADQNRDKPIAVEALCTQHHVDLAIQDHTAGFSLPGHIAPPDTEIERGRGLYLIRSMVDEVRYVPEPAGNTLHLRKYRTDHSSR